MLNLTPPRDRAACDAVQTRTNVIESLRRFADRVAASQAAARRARPRPTLDDEPSSFWILHAR
ncbi:MAG: hypothetical protein NVS3B7_02780 [Candidatus Elarobacter sp.]